MKGSRALRCARWLAMLSVLSVGLALGSSAWAASAGPVTCGSDTMTVGFPSAAAAPHTVVWTVLVREDALLGISPVRYAWSGDGIWRAADGTPVPPDSVETASAAGRWQVVQVVATLSNQGHVLSTDIVWADAYTGPYAGGRFCAWPPGPQDDEWRETTYDAYGNVLSTQTYYTNRAAPASRPRRARCRRPTTRSGRG